MNGENDRYALQAARVLATKLPTDPPRPSALGRDAMVAQMVKAIEERGRRKKIYIGATVLALAASALFIVKATSLGSVEKNGDPALFAPIVEDILGADNLLVRQGSTRTLRGPMALMAGDQLVASRMGGTSLSFADGTRADLARESDVAIVELGKDRRLSLGQGRIDVHVAKLGSERRFQVSTPDTVVEVHGTVFSVFVEKSGISCPGETSKTRVRVSEGVVSVDHGGKRVFLRPGETWPCAETVAPVAPVAIAPTTDTRPAPAAKRPRARAMQAREEDFKRKPTVFVDNISNLAEQNDLFSEAMSAEKRNQREAALEKLGTLLQKFPDGPLGESARAERRKLLGTNPSVP